MKFLLQMAALILCLLSVPAGYFLSSAISHNNYSINTINQREGVSRQPDLDYMVLRAYKAAYPGLFDKGPYKVKKGWALQKEGTTFVSYEGRILPEEMVSDYASFRPTRFYRYSENLLPMPFFTGDAEKKFLKRLEESEKETPLPVNEEFKMALYGGSNRKELEAITIEVSFLDFDVIVNPILKMPLERVEGKIQSLSDTDEEIKEFLDNLKSVSGYNWRDVSFFSSMSYHAYGMAIDFLPKRWEGEAYWFWARDSYDDWYNLPYEKRWMIPEKIVAIFEEEGFIWGGKWLYFDTMHFEYRPEFKIYNESRSYYEREP